MQLARGELANSLLDNKKGSLKSFLFYVMDDCDLYLRVAFYIR